MQVNERTESSDSINIEVGVNLPTGRVMVIVLKPIFKNGKIYKKGSKVELNKLSAENFAREGDVEIL